MEKRTHYYIKNRQNGSTLIETLIILTFVAMAGLAITRFTKDTKKDSSSHQFKEVIK